MFELAHRMNLVYYIAYGRTDAFRIGLCNSKNQTDWIYYYNG